jgi:hypothetical protein
MTFPGAVSLSCFVLCGANLAAGGLYLALYLKRRQTPEHLPFALLCFAIAAYDLFCAGLYGASSLEEGVFWQRLQVLAFVPIGILLVWFVGLVAEGRLSGPLRAFVAAFAVLGLVAVVIGGPGVTLSVETPDIKTVRWGGRAVITYYESQLGWLIGIGIALFFLAVGHAAYQAWRAYRASRSPYLRAILLGLVAYAAGLLNDTLVDSGVSPGLYLSEYAYLALVAIMGVALLNRYDDLHLEIEQLNVGLERRVLEAVAEIKVLSGLIPICAGCKKVRRDGGYWQQVEEYISEHSDARFSHGMCQECMQRLYPEIMQSRAAKERAAVGQAETLP